MNSNPLFSVLIANYNNGKYLEECILSVFSQTYENWEIILVDDCSTDGLSKQIYEKYQDNDKIKIEYNKENRGAGYTKMRCAELATGAIAGYVDPDDSITTNAIALSVQAHLKDESSSLIYSNLYVCDMNMQMVSERRPPKKEEVSSMVFGSYVQAINHFATFKNDLYKKTDGISPDLKRAVDKDLYYKLEEVGEIGYLDETLYNYRIHSGGISTESNRLKAEYWSWVVLIRMAERRGLNLEHYYENEIQRKILAAKKNVHATRDFKLGRSILSPMRSMYNLVKGKS